MWGYSKSRSGRGHAATKATRTVKSIRGSVTIAGEPIIVLSFLCSKLGWPFAIENECTFGHRAAKSTRRTQTQSCLLVPAAAAHGALLAAFVCLSRIMNYRSRGHRRNIQHEMPIEVNGVITHCTHAYKQAGRPGGKQARKSHAALTLSTKQSARIEAVRLVFRSTFVSLRSENITLI